MKSLAICAVFVLWTPAQPKDDALLPEPQNQEQREDAIHQQEVEGKLPGTMTVPPQASDDVVSIFNGSDLTGWQLPPDPERWRVEDGVLSCRSGPQKRGSILWTEKVYRDFVVQLQFRFRGGSVDSGVFLRSENEQIQIGISGSLQRDMTCSPYIGSRRGYPVEAEGVALLLKQEDWNDLQIAAEGNRYTVWLNGRKVLSWQSDTAVETGRIGLQLHDGRDMAIDFRQITLVEL